MAHLSFTKLSRSQSWISIWLLVVTVFPLSLLAHDIVAVDVSNTSEYKELVRRGILVVDELHRPSFGRRQAPSNNTDTGATSTPISSSPTSVATSSSTSSPTGVPTTLPVPFDTSLGSNFTDSSCPAYFTQFLSDSTFRSCLPVSLLLQNSMSFFQTVRSSSALQNTLDASCSASLAVCSPLMAKLAQALISPGNCQNDYQRQNPLVMQAYAGLKAYEPLYQATCLKDGNTGRYCFVEGMESATADDSYPYYAGVGLQLPTNAKPTCSPCLKQTMTIFAGYAVQKDQPLGQTYLRCATQIDASCGEGFASTQSKSVSNGASSNVPGGSPVRQHCSLVALLLVLGCMFA